MCREESRHGTQECVRYVPTLAICGVLLAVTAAWAQDAAPSPSLGDVARKARKDHSSVDHVPAKQAGLPTVWINRRHDNPGWGATPAPQADVTPDWTFTSMAAFADAVEADRGSGESRRG